MNKLIELRRAKMLALSLLLIAAATFVVTLFLPPNFWVSGVKAIAEAAMVGALADWFAVVALFRRVPIPIISRHTAIIPRNKDRIGENLGQLIKDEAGKEMILSYLNQGDFIGELGLFEEGQERSAWVRAKTACEVAEMQW